MSQKNDAAAQATEIKLNTLSAVVASGDLRGVPRKKDITESKPVNKLKEFGGGDREQFREWARTLTEVMQQLRPGARTVMREVDVTDKDIWNKAAHDDVCCDSIAMQDMHETLNGDIWWVLSQKTTGGTLSMVTSVEYGMGLEAYRKISSWYNNMNQVSVHEFRGKVLHPQPATKET